MNALKLSAEEAKQERLDTFCRILTKVDRTITGRVVDCKRTEEQERFGHKVDQAPAFTDGEAIYFNIDKIGDLSTPEEVVILNGLNYHELCHVLYTPRSHPVLNRLRRAGMFDSFNALEDQRIESMFIGLYPGTKPYFRLTAMKHLLSRPADLDGQLPLVWGRRYLGASIRNSVSDAFRSQKDVARIKEIIDEFRKLILPRDMDTAELLVREFHRLLQSSNPNQSEPDDPFGHDKNRPEIEKGNPDGAREQAATQGFREDEDEIQDEEDEEEQESTESEDQDESEDTESEDTGDGEGDEGEDEDDSDEDGEDGEGSGEDTSNRGTGDLGDDQDTDEAEGEGSSGGDGGDSEDGDSDGDEGDSNATEGTGHGAGGPGEMNRGEVDLEKLQKDLQDGIDEVMSSTEVQDDANQKLRTLQKGDNNMDAPFAEAPYAKDSVNPSDRNISGKVAKQFQNLVRDLDPGFHTHKSAGRVNMGRAMRGDDIDTVFDQWDEGKFDASDIELVIGLDMSSSMGGQMEGASRALWTILSAVRSLGNTVSAQAIGFESDTAVLYGPNDKVEKSEVRIFPPQGGTQALDMVSHAKKIFRKSRKAHKIFITISDGEWWDTAEDQENPDDIIDAMNKAGVHTGAFFLDPHNSVADRKERFTQIGRTDAYEAWLAKIRHNSTVFTAATGTSDIIPFISNIVKSAMRSK